MLIALQMTSWHPLALLSASLLLMHAFVYAVDFRGGHGGVDEGGVWSLFLRFTLVGYTLALLLSAFTLWSFGRFEGTALLMGVREVIVLAVPASLGAAAARLIL